MRPRTATGGLTALTLAALLGLALAACSTGDGEDDGGSDADRGGPGDDRGGQGDDQGGPADGPGPDGTVDPCGERNPFAGGRLPGLLSEAGLYEDIALQKIDARKKYYTVHFPLWADLAGKDRWIHLPCDAQIDTSDMDYWQFPPGTRFYKTFGGTSELSSHPFETRVIARYGPGPDDFVFATYAWRADGSDAELVSPAGAEQAEPPYRYPSLSDCKFCHNNHPSRVLGFSALQLSGTSLYNLSSLVQEGRLTDDPPAEGYRLPGDEAVQQGLGYLQGNCSHCHNPSGVQFKTPYSLFTSVQAQLPEDTDAYRTAVGVPLEGFEAPEGITLRIAPGDPEASAVIFRMTQRTPGQQMPPVATRYVDYTAVYLKVGQWIASISN